MGPRYRIYEGTHQRVWHRDINGTRYAFTQSHSRPLILVSRETEDGWEEVHCFTG